MSSTEAWLAEGPTGPSSGPFGPGYVRLDEAAAHGLGCCLGAGGDAEALKDMLELALDAGGAPAEGGADLLVAGSGGDEAEHLDILVAEPGVLADLAATQVGELLEHPIHQTGGDQPFTAVYGVD